MVEIETARRLYKKKLVEPGGAGGGAAPSEPAAVDTDGDGYADRIYIGTNRGLMYRADLRGPAGELPELEPVTLSSAQGLPSSVGAVTVQRIPASDVRFAPRVIFKASDAVTPATPARTSSTGPGQFIVAATSTPSHSARQPPRPVEAGDRRAFSHGDDIPPQVEDK